MKRYKTVMSYVISLITDALHYFVGTNSSVHQVNVVALSKVLISNSPTLTYHFFSCRILFS
jgi:hypothetical protein